MWQASGALFPPGNPQPQWIEAMDRRDDDLPAMPGVNDRPTLLAELTRLQEENALLRRALDERTMAPATRRRVGRVIAVLVLLVSGASVGVFLEHTAYGRSMERAFMKGFNAVNPPHTQPPKPKP